MISGTSCLSLDQAQAGNGMKTNVAVIGAGTSGSYIAKLMSEKGFDVRVIDLLPKEKIGTKYDIFHIEEKEFSALDIPRPERGDRSWAFEFSENLTADPKNLYPKRAENPVVGLHMHEYTAFMNEWAASFGAGFIYEAAFDGFILDDGVIRGLRYKKDGGTHELFADVVVDCSGIGAAGRRCLPSSYGPERFSLSGEDMFYVILRYVKLLDKKDHVKGSCGWPFFKSWIAPCADPEGAIIGIGACHSFEYAEEMYSKMLEHIKLPEHEVIKIEKGRTPYTRPPYSFVGDNFVVSGDAACLTKSLNGEGVTSSMYQLRIVSDVFSDALRRGDTSKRALWPINVGYNRTQGAEFASLRALLVGVVNAASLDEFEYAFESGMITDELIGGGDLGAKDVLSAALKLLSGIAKGRVSLSTMAAAAKALSDSSSVRDHYLSFPEDPALFYPWCVKADRLWRKIGKIK